MAKSMRSLDVSTLEGWLWEAACAIRGPLDAPKFKDYILPLNFLKRLSDVFEDEVERLGRKFGGKEIAADLVEQDHELVRFYVPPKARWQEIRQKTVGLAEHVAILRSRLYDVDLLINRTLVYVSLTAALIALYLGGIVVLQYVLRALTGGESTLAVVVSTLTIAALFNPLRRRIQGLVDRRFYRSKYDARKTLEAFSSTVRDETDLKALKGHLFRVMAETMQPAHACLWLRSDTVTKDQQVE